MASSHVAGVYVCESGEGGHTCLRSSQTSTMMCYSVLNQWDSCYIVLYCRGETQLLSPVCVQLVALFAFCAAGVCLKGQFTQITNKPPTFCHLASLDLFFSLFRFWDVWLIIFSLHLLCSKYLNFISKRKKKSVMCLFRTSQALWIIQMCEQLPSLLCTWRVT